MKHQRLIYSDGVQWVILKQAFAYFYKITSNLPILTYTVRIKEEQARKSLLWYLENTSFQQETKKICAWCDKDKRVTRQLKRESYLVTHEICDKHQKAWKNHKAIKRFCEGIDVSSLTDSNVYCCECTWEGIQEKSVPEKCPNCGVVLYKKHEEE